MISRRKQILFFIVFLLLVILIIYRVLNPFEQARTQKLTFTGKPAVKMIPIEKAKKSANRQENSMTNISFFLNKPKVSGKVYTDLFAIYRPPHKKKIKSMVKKNIQKQTIPQIIKKDPVADIKEYITSYTLYGTYKTKNKKAVFLAKNKLVLVAGIGDRLDGKYQIDEIQDNYIQIKALDLNETIYLDMREFNNE